MSDVAIVSICAIGAATIVIICVVIFVGKWGKKGKRTIEE